MGEVKIADLIITPLRIIPLADGDVFHGMKSSDLGYKGFGEAYFSSIKKNAIKAWKRHNKMTLNLIVPVGAIRFVIYDDREKSITKNCFQIVELSRENYCRFTVPPCVWMGFKGLSDEVSLLLNIADISHDPNEIERKSIEEIKYDWSK